MCGPLRVTEGVVDRSLNDMKHRTIRVLIKINAYTALNALLTTGVHDVEVAEKYLDILSHRVDTQVFTASRNGNLGKRKPIEEPDV